MKKVNRGTILVISATVMLIAITVTFIIYYNNVQATLDNQMNSYLLKTAQQNAQTVDKQLNSDLLTIKSIAQALSSQDDLDDERLISMIKSYNSNNTYKRLGIVNANGKAITTDGIRLDLSDREFFTTGMAGKDAISKTIFDRSDGKPINVLSSPIYNSNGIVRAVLFATYDTGKYEKTLSMEWFSDNGTTFLATNDGTILFDKSGNNEQSLMKRIQTEYVPVATQSINKMRDNMLAGEQGIFEFRDADSQGFVVYTPIKFEDWYCVCILPNEQVQMQGQKIAKSGGIMTVFVALFVLAFSAIVLLYYRKNYSDLKKLNKNIALTQERYKIIAEQSNSVIFDCKLSDKTIYISSIFEKKFGYVAPSTDFPDSALKRSIISKEDADVFLSAFNACSRGEKYSEAEVRVKTDNGKYIWCLFRMTTMFDDHKKPYRILGKIIDIDKTKRKTAILTERSCRDGLTGFYNKDSAKEMITEFLSSRENELCSAMFLIDIDNFKSVNDRLGHLIGDRCIKEIARTVSDVFLSGDILARVGGDEFTVFVKEVASENDAYEKGQILCKALGMCHVTDNNGAAYSVTASVGVAIVKNNADSSDIGAVYEKLFKQADIAMYYSKKRGKNQCTNYTKEKEQALYDGREFMLSLTGEIDTPKTQDET